jgi:PAS domain S-box-containing protein
MILPRPTSIRHRLLALSAAISVLTLTMAGSLFVINDVAMLRHQMVRDLEVLSIVVGDNCLSALAFDAPETALKNLSSLRREYQIRYAALYDAAGRPFAHYRREGALQRPVPSHAEDGTFVDVSPIGLGTIEVVRTLQLDEQPIGRLFIHARTDELAAQLRRYAGIVVLLLVATLSASLLLAWRLQRRVSQPILELAAMTQQVSECADYRLRVTPPAADDELATLYRGFNAMLEQIEHRDRELTGMGARLEHLVEERTRDLDTVVREQRLIVEALPLGIIHLVGRRIARVNTRAAELFGLRSEDMIGRSTEEFYPDRADFEEVGQQGYAQMASGGIYRDDRILKRHDGSRFWGRLIGQYIDPSNERLGSIWIVDDIGRDKALEERLRQAREAAEAASRAKDTFMANMSHELRTPLNSVLGFVQLLDTDPGLSNAQREQVKSIRRGGERLLGLINEVLDLAKIEADRLELAPVDWDCAALLQELDAMFRPRTEQKGIALRIEPAAELPPRLRCDARRLHQVLVNLLDNAVKFTNDG